MYLFSLRGLSNETYTVMGRGSKRGVAGIEGERGVGGGHVAGQFSLLQIIM